MNLRNLDTLRFFQVFPLDFRLESRRHNKRAQEKKFGAVLAALQAVPLREPYYVEHITDKLLFFFLILPHLSDIDSTFLDFEAFYLRALWSELCCFL